MSFDILISPGSFWGGAFEICASLQQKGVMEHRNVSAKKRLEMSIERSKQVAANQVGRAINMMVFLGMSDSEIVEYLRRKDGALPHRLNPASFMIKEKRACEYIHDYEKEIEIIKFDEYGMVLDSLGHLND